MKSHTMRMAILEAELVLNDCLFCSAVPDLKVPDRYASSHSIHHTEIVCPKCDTRVISDTCTNRNEQIADVVNKWNSHKFEPGRTEIEYWKKMYLGVIK